MSINGPGSLEAFLIEDMVLTLANLRGSLGWLGGEALACDPAGRRAGLQRLERQLDMLEARARDCLTDLQQRPPAPPDAPHRRMAGLVADDDAATAAMQNIFADVFVGGGDHGDAAAAVFRSRRWQ
jgi:hypothetical protein